MPVLCDYLRRKALDDLIIEDVELEGDLPECPCEITGGDMTDNIYTYRDHAPLPINWIGEVGAISCAPRLRAPWAK